MGSKPGVQGKWLPMFDTILVKGWRVEEQPCVVGGVVIDVYIIVVQGETVRARVAIVGVEDNEVDYLFRHLTFGVGVAR